MILRIGLASLMALAVATAPAAAGQTSVSADDNRIVCKKQDRPNSRFKDKVCKTSAQWEELRIQQQRDAKEMVDRPQIDTDRPGRGE